MRAALSVVMLNSVSCASVHQMKLNPLVFNGNVDSEDWTVVSPEVLINNFSNAVLCRSLLQWGLGVNMSYVCYVHTINCSQRHPSLAAFRIFGSIWCSKLTQKYNTKSGWFKILTANQWQIWDQSRIFQKHWAIHCRQMSHQDAPASCIK